MLEGNKMEDCRLECQTHFTDGGALALLQTFNTVDLSKARRLRRHSDSFVTIYHFFAQDRGPLFPGSSCFPLSPDHKHKCGIPDMHQGNKRFWTSRTQMNSADFEQIDSLPCFNESGRAVCRPAAVARSHGHTSICVRTVTCANLLLPKQHNWGLLFDVQLGRGMLDLAGVGSLFSC